VPNECDAPEIQVSEVYVLRAPADVENLKTALGVRHRPRDRKTAPSQSKPEVGQSPRGERRCIVSSGWAIVSHVANDCYDCSWRKIKHLILQRTH
jgi:hypothetical protein